MLQIKLVLMAFIWATSYPLGRWLGVYEAPEAIVVSRVFIAFLFLCLVARVRNEPSIPFKMPVWIQLFVLGFFGFCIHNYLMFAALEHTEAGKGAIINGAIPAIVMILNYLFYRQKITLLSLLGVILSVSGVVLVVTEGKIYNLLNLNINKGEFMFLIAIMGWSLYSVIARPLLETYRAIWVTAYSCLAGGILMLPLLGLNLGPTLELLSDPFVVLILLIQGVLTMGLGFLWYYEGIKSMGPVSASMYLNLIPIFGVFLALITIGEVPSLPVVVGGVAVIFGVLMTNFKNL